LKAKLLLTIFLAITTSFNGCILNRKPQLDVVRPDEGLLVDLIKTDELYGRHQRLTLTYIPFTPNFYIVVIDTFQSKQNSKKLISIRSEAIIPLAKLIDEKILPLNLSPDKPCYDCVYYSVTIRAGSTIKVFQAMPEAIPELLEQLKSLSGMRGL